MNYEIFQWENVQKEKSLTMNPTRLVVSPVREGFISLTAPLTCVHSARVPSLIRGEPDPPAKARARNR